jgi:hypothetical protein
MSEPSALFVRISMSEAACRRWLDSPIKFIGDYDDWQEMNPTAARDHESWLEARLRREFVSVREFFDTAANESRFFCCEYDDDLRAFFAADARHEASMAGIAASVAALRGVESFKDDDEPSFIYVFPAFSGGDPEALLRVKRGSSVFLPPNDDAPDVLCFTNEAEEFIEDLTDDDG